MTKKGVAVVAVGGNSLIKDEKHQISPGPVRCRRRIMSHIADMIEAGWDVAIRHGNGPQVGFILAVPNAAKDEACTKSRWITAARTPGRHRLHALQQTLQNDIPEQQLDKNAVAMVTQMLVDATTKPSESHQAHRLLHGRSIEPKNAPRRIWTVVEDAGRGWRRVVASPIPKRIVEAEAIQESD